MTETRRLRGDSGMTLPEMLMTIALLGVIMVAITGALMVSIGPDQQAYDRLKASHDSQLVAIWLPRDLQSADTVDTDPAGASLCAGSGTEVLGLGWSQSAGDGAGTYGVSYRTLQADDEWQLVRYECFNGAVERTIVAAHDLANGSSATVSTSGVRISLRLTGSTGEITRVTGTRRMIPPICFATAVTLDPGSPQKATVAPGPITKSVSITVLTNGKCTGALAAAFTPDTTEATLALSQSGTTYTGTIEKATYSWSAGVKSITIREAGTDVLGGTADLTVRDYQECNASAFAVTPETVNQSNAAGNLDSALSISATVSGVCAEPLRVSFTTKTGAQTKDLTYQSASDTWTGTIAANDYTWNSGTATFTLKQADGLDVPIGASLTTTDTVTITPFCSVSSVTPKNPAVDRNPKTGQSAQPLKDPTTFTVTTSGYCAGPTISFSGGPANGTPYSGPQTMTGGNGTWMFTVQAISTQKWKPGTYTVTISQGSDVLNNTPATAATFTVR